MAIPIPNRTSDNLTLISIEDEAIDITTPPGKDALTAYMTADVPMVDSLILTEDAAPWQFTIRGLNEMELSLVDGMSRGDVWGDGANSGAITYAVLRFALVSVKGDGAPELERVRLYGSDVITQESVSWIPRLTAAWLAGIVARWSRLSPEKKSSCTS